MYTLVICEKPDAARRVSESLSEGRAQINVVDGTTVFRFARKGEEFVVCAAQGHLYGVSDPTDERAVYPVFDVEWYSSDLVKDGGAGVASRISAIRKLAAGASRFVNACDFDAEGETIGFNVLRYACGVKEGTAMRAKFSTLTHEDLAKAFDALESKDWHGLAKAGRARHAIDFVWGVNLSRALSQSTLGLGHRYMTVSIGRVQGPTLGFLVQREREIREFVSVPYWQVSGIFGKDGKTFAAGYADERVETKEVANKIREDALGKEAVASEVRLRLVQVGPPVPFNIGDLQKEAYRAFRYTPRRTLQIAERLYLNALISYPRTGSQRLPPSLGYRAILQGIGRHHQYSALVDELLRTEPKPVQGAGADQAHPAIHPTGELPRGKLDGPEASIFDLVVRRFLSAFGPTARREIEDVIIQVGEHEFRLSAGRTIFAGWMSYYGRYAGYKETEFSHVSKGDRFRVEDVSVEEKFEQKPTRYNQSTLLEKMEREEIGTKATRADIISTLIERGYVSGDSMEVTDVGLSVAETAAKYAPQIMSTDLTRRMEEKLGEVEGGVRGEAELLRETVRTIAGELERLASNEAAVGKEIDAALVSAAAKAYVLGKCPVCGSGELKIIRSKATKKRFVGCSNYPNCRASAPLPQKGAITVAGKACSYCRWPVVFAAGRGMHWRFCVNSDCPGKTKR